MILKTFGCVAPGFCIIYSQITFNINTKLVSQPQPRPNCCQDSDRDVPEPLPEETPLSYADALAAALEGSDETAKDSL